MLLTHTLAANFGRIESRYPSVDMLEVSLRRSLNLTEDWLLSVVTEDDWNKHYKEILTANFEDAERLEEQREAWPEGENGKGEFILVRKEQPETANISFKPAKPSP